MIKKLWIILCFLQVCLLSAMDKAAVKHIVASHVAQKNQPHALTHKSTGVGFYVHPADENSIVAGQSKTKFPPTINETTLYSEVEKVAYSKNGTLFQDGLLEYRQYPYKAMVCGVVKDKNSNRLITAYPVLRYIFAHELENKLDSHPIYIMTRHDRTSKTSVDVYSTVGNVRAQALADSVVSQKTLPSQDEKYLVDISRRYRAEGAIESRLILAEIVVPK